MHALLATPGVQCRLAGLGLSVFACNWRGWNEDQTTSTDRKYPSSIAGPGIGSGSGSTGLSSQQSAPRLYSRPQSAIVSSSSLLTPTAGRANASPPVPPAHWLNCHRAIFVTGTIMNRPSQKGGEAGRPVDYSGAEKLHRTKHEAHLTLLPAPHAPYKPSGVNPITTRTAYWLAGGQADGANASSPSYPA